MTAENNLITKRPRGEWSVAMVRSVLKLTLVTAGAVVAMIAALSAHAAHAVTDRQLDPYDELHR